MNRLQLAIHFKCNALFSQKENYFRVSSAAVMISAFKVN